MRKIVFLLFVLLLCSNVLAIGITPGRTTFDYTPGTSKTVPLTVINSEGRAAQFVVLVQGELNASVTLSEVVFSMKDGEASRTIDYRFTVPANLAPGPHTTDVIVVQLPEKAEKSEAFIGASVGVASQISLFVPYPGKYAESSLNVIGPDSDGKLTFVMPVVSRGKQDLARVHAIIDIYGALNEKIATLTTNQISVLSGERKELAVSWLPNVAPGNYRAVATLVYDEQTVRLEKEFAVGTPTLELRDLQVNDFILGQIAKFELLVENKWSQPITGAYAQMLVYDKDKQVIADFKSQTYDVKPLESVIMAAFWDTAGIRKGTYDSTLFLRYGAQSIQRDFKLEVSDRSINAVGVGYVISKDSKSSLGGNYLVIILVIAVVLLILINLLWFLVLRKRFSKKK